MGYRIEYGNTQKAAAEKNHTHARLRTLTAACFLCLTIAVKCLWPEGTGVLHRCFGPESSSQTQLAMEDLLDDLRRGASVEDALTAFCIGILDLETDN